MICNGCKKPETILSPSGFCASCLAKIQILLEHELYIRKLYAYTYENQGSDSVRSTNETPVHGLSLRTTSGPLLESASAESKKWTRLLKQILQRGS